MKVNVIGGGPAGLYAALLLKKLRPNSAITVFERNPADATYGFGVVLADQGLQQLRTVDRASHDQMLGSMEMLSEQVIVHPNGRVIVDSAGGAGSISRLRLLQILQDCCRAEDVKMIFNHDVEASDDYLAADLVIAADGINSVVRHRFAHEFGTTVSFLNNRFAWYGVEKPFPAPALSFRKHDQGSFVGHYYRYSPSMSTFVAECDSETWVCCGLDRMDDEERKSYCEKVFAQDLEGHALISNRSTWRQFPVVQNERWVHKNVVLLGDAQRSVHFSIGSGTRLALEDAAALYNAFKVVGDDVPAALAHFEKHRRPAVRVLTGAAQRSFEWYEMFAQKMRLELYDFAYDYMTRTGRMSDRRLYARHPKFMQAFEQSRSTTDHHSYS